MTGQAEGRLAGVAMNLMRAALAVGGPTNPEADCTIFYLTGGATVTVEWAATRLLTHKKDTQDDTD